MRPQAAAVAAMVDRQHPVAGGDQRRRRRPHQLRSALAIQPCSSITGGAVAAAVAEEELAAAGHVHASAPGGISSGGTGGQIRRCGRIGGILLSAAAPTIGSRWPS